jgi:hypothetical protein
MLQFCSAGDVRNALIAALEDTSITVQLAARSSLEALNALTEELVVGTSVSAPATTGGDEPSLSAVAVAEELP